MNTAFIRKHNASSVFHALREYPESSQRQLCEYTSLDKATVSTVIADLEKDGLVKKVALRRGRVGRPEVILAIAEEAGVLIGVRLEPDFITFLATHLNGQKIDTLVLKSSKNVNEVVKLLHQGTAHLLHNLGFSMHHLKAMGVCVPGLIDRLGKIVLAPNFSWQNVSLLPKLQKFISTPIYIDNDTSAAALAEKLFGSCKKANDFILIVSQSGVGGALFLNGILYQGTSGFAGELGHVTAVHNGRLCGCGKHGCLEAYLAESALLKILNEKGLRLDDPEALLNEAKKGTPLVLEVVHEAGQHLGRVLANLVNTLNPDTIVLGGHLAVIAPYILPAIEQSFKENALLDPRKQVSLMISSFGSEAVPMGGVALALEGILSLPDWLMARKVRKGVS